MERRETYYRALVHGVSGLLETGNYRRRYTALLLLHILHGYTYRNNNNSVYFVALILSGARAWILHG